MPGAQHRPGAGPSRGQTCRRGHDLTLEGAIVVRGDVERCSVCLRVQRKGEDTKGRNRAMAHANCTKCGVRKFRDLRPLCFGCSAAKDVDAGRMTPAQVDAALTDAQLLECAPLYIKKDKREHASWLAWRRKQMLGDREP